MSRLRFGIVGCGAIVTLHQLPAFKRCALLDVVALTDVDAAWAARVARRFGVPESHEDHRALVGRVDAALVATPNATHAEIACTLLEQGIHVLCEKPAATSVADVDRMYAAAERGRARLMIGHSLRFSPNFAMLERIVTGGWLGAPESITVGIGAPYAEGAQRTDFRRQRRLSGGGVLMDLGIHVIDLAVWLAGSRPEGVRSLCVSAGGWEVESDAEVALEFRGGLHAALSASFTQMLANTLVVRGSTGWAQASLYVPSSLAVCATSARVCRRAGGQEVVLPDQSMYDRQIEHFCTALRSGDEFIVRPTEIRAGIDVVEQCYRAAA